MNETIGQRLFRLRQEAGLSQRELSTPGVSYAYISRIEAGSRQPSVKALRKLASKLGVTTAYLEFGEQRTETDALVNQIRDAFGITQIEIDIRKGVRLTWSRDFGNRTDEERAAHLPMGVSPPRTTQAPTVTQALHDLRAYEQRVDEIDADALRLYRERLELDGRITAEVLA